MNVYIICVIKDVSKSNWGISDLLNVAQPKIQSNNQHI